MAARPRVRPVETMGPAHRVPRARNPDASPIAARLRGARASGRACEKREAPGTTGLIAPGGVTLQGMAGGRARPSAQWRWPRSRWLHTSTQARQRPHTKSRAGWSRMGTPGKTRGCWTGSSRGAKLTRHPSLTVEGTAFGSDLPVRTGAVPVPLGCRRIPAQASASGSSPCDHDHSGPNTLDTQQPHSAAEKPVRLPGRPPGGRENNQQDLQSSGSKSAC